MTTTQCETKYPLCMIAGTTFTRTIRLLGEDGTPMDLTGYKAEIHIRGRVADTDPLIECNLSLTHDEGKIVWTITPGETLDLDAVHAGRAVKGVWDLRITNLTTGASDVYYPASEFVIYTVSTR